MKERGEWKKKKKEKSQTQLNWDELNVKWSAFWYFKHFINNLHEHSFSFSFRLSIIIGDEDEDDDEANAKIEILSILN